MPQLTLTLDKLVAGREGVGLIAPISLTISPGHWLAIRGPNGVGKTSLLRTLAGLVPIISGGFAFKTATGESLPADQVVGMIGHLDGLRRFERVGEHLTFCARLYGSQSMLEAFISELRLGPLLSARSETLSAGQRKRVMLARLRLSLRPVWLMDEPNAALDTAGRQLVADMIEAHCAAGGMALACLHEPLPITPAAVLDLVSAT